MQVTIESTSELSRKMTVQVPEEKIQEQVAQRIKSMAGKVRIDGFRPGKVPASVIEKRFGAGVRQEVVTDLIQSSFYDAVRDEKLKPVAGPLITEESSEEGQGLTYVADFEVLPEFVLYPLEEMEIERVVAEVTDKDLDDMLQRLREQRKTWQATDNASAIDHRVTIHFEGVAEGENFTNGKQENFPVLLGSNQMIEGFEQELVGLAVGAQKTFSLPFPADYRNEKLAGKSGEFSIEVTSVEEGVLPELNEEFAKAFGIEDGDIDTFKGEIKSSMEREMRRGLATRNKNAVMEELLKRNDGLVLPTVLVNEELKSLLNAYKSEREKQRQTFDEAAAKQHFEGIARRRVALGLLLNRVIETNAVKLDNAKVRSTIEDMALSYENPEEVVNWYYANREELSNVQNMVIEDQVVDLVLARAKITDKPVAFPDLMQPATAAAAQA